MNSTTETDRGKPCHDQYPPAPGGHTGSVLTEVPGLSPEDSASLSAGGVIPGPAAPEVRLREAGKGPG